MDRQATRQHRPPARDRPDRPRADRSAAGAGQWPAAEGAAAGTAPRAGTEDKVRSRTCFSGAGPGLYADARPAAGADDPDDDGAADRLARGETHRTATAIPHLQDPRAGQTGRA